MHKLDIPECQTIEIVQLSNIEISKRRHFSTCKFLKRQIDNLPTVQISNSKKSTMTMHKVSSAQNEKTYVSNIVIAD